MLRNVYTLQKYLEKFIKYKEHGHCIIKHSYEF